MLRDLLQAGRSTHRRMRGNTRRRLRVDQLEDRAVPAAFTPGNIVLHRIGDGAAALSNTGAAVFLDEYTPAGALVQSVAMPTTVSGANKQLIASGTATSEGLISRSADGEFLLLTGYARDLGGTGALQSTTSAAVNRTVGVVRYDGAVDTSTALGDFSDGSSPRAATSTNGIDLWLAGGAGGVRYAAKSSTTSSSVSTTTTNLRQIGIFGNQLYTSTASGTTFRIGAVGTGTPTGTGETTSSIPGYPTSGGGPYAFFFADLDAGVAGVDTLYVADESAVALAKFSLVGGNWTSNGAVGVETDDYRGVTGIVNGTTVTLFAVRKGGSTGTGGGELVKIDDNTGYNGTFSGTPTLLASAATNMSFRGVAPTPEHANVGPVNTLPASFNVTEDTDKFLTGISVADADAGSANIRVTFSVPTGTGVLTLRTDVAGGLGTGDVVNNGTRVVEITASLAKINATLTDAAGLKYSPAANLYGNVTLTMVANDLGNSGGGGAKSDTDTATLAIAGVADTPSITNATTNEDEPTSSGLVVSRHAADGNEVSHFKITNIQNGSLYQNDGSTPITAGAFITYAEASTGLKFAPAADFNGNATFDLQASTANSDSGLGGSIVTANITVNAVNDKPGVNGDFNAWTTLEETPFGVTGLSVYDVDAGSADVRVRFGFFGPFNVNTSVPGGVTAGQVVNNGSDVVDINAPLAAINATLADPLGVTYTPPQNWTGQVYFFIQLFDLGNTGGGGAQFTSETLSVIVDPVNDAPTIYAPTSLTIDEDTDYSFFGDLSITIIDPDFDQGTESIQVTMTATNGILEMSDTTNVTVTGNGTGHLVMSGAYPDVDAARGTLAYRPNANYYGAAQMTVSAFDFGNTGAGDPQTTTSTIDITINPVNDAPDLGDYAFNIPATIPIGGVVGTVTATDVDGDGLSYAITAGNTGNRFAIDASGAITILDNSNLAGTYVIEVTATDDAAPSASDVGQVTIRVNTPPVAHGIPDQTIAEDDPGVPVIIDLAAAFDDAEDADATLTFSVVGNSNAALFSSAVVSGLTLRVTPAANAFGVSDITVRAADPAGNFTDSTFKFTINPVNDVPTIDAIADINIDEDAPEQTINLTGITVGPANEAAAGQTIASVVAVSSVPGLILHPTILFDGSNYTLKFTPVADANGTAEITVTVTDSGTGSNQSFDKFLVNVAALPDGPEFDTTLTPMLPAIVKLPPKVIPDGSTIASLLAGVHDPDVGDAKGIAITGYVQVDAKNKPKGVWQFSLDSGTTWANLPTVGATSAFHLSDDPATRIRFLPNRGTRGFFSMSLVAWDQTNGVPEGALADPAASNTAYSTATERAWVAVGVTSPKVDNLGRTVIKPIKEDTKQSPPLKVSTILGIAGLESLPKANLGMALTDAGTGDGKWQYKLFKTKDFVDVGAVSATSALLLGPKDMLRFVPKPNADGAGTLSFKTWDNTGGTTGTKVDPTGDDSFGVDPGNVVLDIIAINDAPTLSSTGASLGTVAPSATTGLAAFNSFFGPNDAVDAEGITVGIAITATSGKGVWEYSTDGVNWIAVGKIVAGKPLLLEAGYRVRFTAAADASPGTASLSFKTWDKTLGTVGNMEKAGLVSKTTAKLTATIL